MTIGLAHAVDNNMFCEIFKPGACGPAAHMRTYGLHVCVSMCTPKGINNQWCYIDHVQLVKHVLWLFPAFDYFI